MTVQTTLIPDPPAGADWRYAVPGINLIDVTTIVATLHTNNNSGLHVIARESINGNDGSYGAMPAPTQLLSLAQPGAIVDDYGWLSGTLDGSTFYSVVAGGGAGPGNVWDGDWTIEWWSQIAAGNPQGNIIEVLFGVDSIIVQYDNTYALILGVTGGKFYGTPAAAMVADGLWHHFVWSYTAGNPAGVTCYRDGVPLAPIGHVGPDPAIPAADTGFVFGDGLVNVPGGIDEVAFYPVALSSVQVAENFAAAAAGIAGYTASVVANGARNLWHLDDLPPAFTRLGALRVANGLDELGLYPAVATQANGTVVQYTWLANARGTPSSATPTAETIGVPPLILPGGYTIQSLTLGIQPTDRWSGVRLLWDDALQNLLPGYDAYAYPPGVQLQYEQAKAGP